MNGTIKLVDKVGMFYSFAAHIALIADMYVYNLFAFVNLVFFFILLVYYFLNSVNADLCSVCHNKINNS